MLEIQHQRQTSSQLLRAEGRARKKIKRSARYTGRWRGYSGTEARQRDGSRSRPCAVFCEGRSERVTLEHIPEGGSWGCVQDKRSASGGRTEAQAVRRGGSSVAAGREGAGAVEDGSFWSVHTVRATEGPGRAPCLTDRSCAVWF